MPTDKRLNRERPVPVRCECEMCEESRMGSTGNVVSGLRVVFRERTPEYGIPHRRNSDLFSGSLHRGVYNPWQDNIYRRSHPGGPQKPCRQPWGLLSFCERRRSEMAWI